MQLMTFIIMCEDINCCILLPNFILQEIEREIISAMRQWWRLQWRSFYVEIDILIFSNEFKSNVYGRRRPSAGCIFHHAMFEKPSCITHVYRLLTSVIQSGANPIKLLTP